MRVDSAILPILLFDQATVIFAVAVLAAFNQLLHNAHNQLHVMLTTPNTLTQVISTLYCAYELYFYEFTFCKSYPIFFYACAKNQLLSFCCTLNVICMIFYMTFCFAEVQNKVESTIGNVNYMCMQSRLLSNPSFNYTPICIFSNLPILSLAMSVVGNKSDLEDMRMVSRDRGEDLAHSLGGMFTETSAARNTGKHNM